MSGEDGYHEAWLVQRTEEEMRALEFCADMSDCREEAEEGLEPWSDTEGEQ